MNTPVKYIKSFCKGQITVPKEFRDILGIEDEFWMRLYLNDGKIIVEPIEKEANKKNFKNKLLKLKGDWFSSSEYARNRQQVEKQIDKLLS